MSSDDENYSENLILKIAVGDEESKKIENDYEKENEFGKQEFVKNTSKKEEMKSESGINTKENKILDGKTEENTKIIIDNESRRTNVNFNPQELNDRTQILEWPYHQTSLNSKQGVKPERNVASKSSDFYQDEFSKASESKNNLFPENHNHGQLLFSRKTEEEREIIISSTAAYTELTSEKCLNYKKISLIFSEKFPVTNLKQLELYLADIQENDALKNLKICIQNYENMEFDLSFCSKLPQNLEVFEIKISSHMELTMKNLECFFNYLKNLKILKINITSPTNVIFPIAQNKNLNRNKLVKLKLQGCLFKRENVCIPFDCPSLEEFCYFIPNENGGDILYILDFFKRCNSLSKIKLAFQGNDFEELLQDFRNLPKLEFFSLIFLNRSKNIAFKDENLSKIFDLMFEKDHDLVNLTNFSLKVENYLSNDSQILKLLQTHNPQKFYPKLTRFTFNKFNLINNPKLLEPLFQSIKIEELNLKSAEFLRSKTMIEFLDKVPEIEQLGKTYNIPEEELKRRYLDLIQEYDKIFFNKEVNPEEKFSKEIRMDDPLTLWFITKSLNIFFESRGKVYLCIKFKKSKLNLDHGQKEIVNPFDIKRYKNDIHIACTFEKENEIDIQNLKILEFKNVLNIKMDFEDCLSILLSYFSFIDEKILLPNICEFVLSIITKTEKIDIEKFKSFHFPKTMQIYRGMAFHLNLEMKNKNDFMNCILKEFSIFLRNASSPKKYLKSLTINLSNNGEIKNFSQIFIDLSLSISENSNLQTFLINLMGTKIDDETFKDSLTPLKKLNKLKSFYLDFQNSNIGGKCIKELSDFLKEDRENLTSFTLHATDNKLKDIDISYLWSSFGNLKHLDELKLYFQKNLLTAKTLTNFLENLSSFPQDILCFKIDFEGNKIGGSEEKELSSIGETFESFGIKIINRFQKLQELSVSFSKCNLSHGQIISFFRGMKGINAKTLSFNFSKSKRFWNFKWTDKELKELDVSMPLDFKGNSLEINILKPQNSENDTLVGHLKKLEEKLQKNKEIKKIIFKYKK